MGAEALKLAYANLSSANPPKEPITIEATNVPNKSQTTEDEHISTSPSDTTKVSPQAFNLMQSSLFSDPFFYQTAPRKMSPQEQRSDNSPVEEDPVDTDTQTIDSLARQTIDGKKFICSFYPSIAIIN